MSRTGPSPTLGPCVTQCDSTSNRVQARCLFSLVVAAIAARMDFTDYDRVDEQMLNEILWHSIKGADVPMPPPVRRAFLSGGAVVSRPAADNDEGEGRRR